MPELGDPDAAIEVEADPAAPVVPDPLPELALLPVLAPDPLAPAAALVVPVPLPEPAGFDGAVVTPVTTGVPELVVVSVTTTLITTGAAVAAAALALGGAIRMQPSAKPHTG